MTMQNKISLAFKFVVESNEREIWRQERPITYLHILCGLLFVHVNLMLRPADLT